MNITVSALITDRSLFNLFNEDFDPKKLAEKTGVTIFNPLLTYIDHELLYGTAIGDLAEKTGAIYAGYDIESAAQTPGRSILFGRFSTGFELKGLSLSEEEIAKYLDIRAYIVTEADKKHKDSKTIIADKIANMARKNEELKLKIEKLIASSKYEGIIFRENGKDILEIEKTADGLILSSGNRIAELKGKLPKSLDAVLKLPNDLSKIWGAEDGKIGKAELETIFAVIEEYDITEMSFRAGVFEIMDWSLTSDAVTLTIAGLRFEATGVTNKNLKDFYALVYGFGVQSDEVSFAMLEKTGFTSFSITASDGTVLMSTDAASSGNKIALESISIEGTADRDEFFSGEDELLLKQFDDAGITRLTFRGRAGDDVVSLEGWGEYFSQNAKFKLNASFFGDEGFDTWRAKYSDLGSEKARQVSFDFSSGAYSEAVDGKNLYSAILTGFEAFRVEDDLKTSTLSLSVLGSGRNDVFSYKGTVSTSKSDAPLFVFEGGVGIADTLDLTQMEMDFATFGYLNLEDFLDGDLALRASGKAFYDIVEVKSDTNLGRIKDVEFIEMERSDADPKRLLVAVSGLLDQKNFTGTQKGETIYGNFLNNLISGLEGDDIIYGRGGNDDLRGGSGNDLIIVEAGNSNIDGGGDSDTLRIENFRGSRIQVTVGATSSQLLFFDMTAAASTGGPIGQTSAFTTKFKSIERVEIDFAEEIEFIGNAKQNIVSILGASSQIFIDGGGGPAADRLELDKIKLSNDLYGLSQSEFMASFDLTKGEGSAYILETQKYDFRAEIKDVEVLRFAVGHDGFEDVAISSLLRGKEVKDGEDGTGTDAIDTFNVGEEDATINARGGNDIIDAGHGKNTVDGGAGNDFFIAAFGTNIFKGQSGRDIGIAFAGSNSFIELDSDLEGDFYAGGSGRDTVKSGGGNDVLIGDYTANQGIGASDFLDGGPGDDLQEGGIGADVFYFEKNDGNDTIGRIDIDWEDPIALSRVSAVDFSSGQDKIQLSGFGYGNSSAAFQKVRDIDGVAVFSDQGTTITFFGLTKSDLASSDFEIV